MTATRRSADLHGILAAVTTPFTADASEIDDNTLRAQADWLIGAGIHGLVTTGTTGEFPTLSPDEYRRVIEVYADAAAGRVPVVAGIGALSTHTAIDLATHAERVGADAIMLLPPFYGGVDEPTLHAFLAAVASSISIPVMYYNIPSSTGTHLSPEQIAHLGDIPGVEYLKDTSGDAVALTELLVDKADRITAFNGWDTLTFVGLASGAKGSVWGAAGIVPTLAVELWNAIAVEGDLARARELWRPLWAISAFLESVDYVAGIKAGLDVVGHSAGPVRPPIQPLPDEQRERFAAILRDAGVL